MYKLLSHNDLDGVGCGILAKLAFGNEVEVRYNSIGSLNREVERFLDNKDKSDSLFITDLSVNEENEKRLHDFYLAGGKLQLIDHHKTALSFNEYDWGHVVVEDEEGKLTSATSLLYQYLTENQFLEASDVVEEFVELVRQYDTWEWEKNENEQARRLNALFFLVAIDEFEGTMLERLNNNEHFSFDEFEKRILDMEDNKIERYIRRKRRELIQKKVGNEYAGVVFAESYHSELGNELGKEYPHLSYIVILNMSGRRMGFRTIHDDVDVSEVAGHFGGGGHAKAAGCTMTDEAYKRFVEETFQLEPIHEDARRNHYNLKASSFGTLYRNRMDKKFLLTATNDNAWVIEKNGVLLDEVFSSFQDAEIFLKRNYEAWLVRDEVFVKFLMEKVKEENK
ncbi:DHH family phosphoesterase [Oceanobacillus bengalensis]|uniref:Oligoribonuclease n=1 Tax=Oceanobacillus bengalensis TaxID=1435466 RepID=A0A494YWF2_9BACI|nr:oligoribonuclease [Oceanobacillus bengalensis]RKQ14546.1 oligoribonuclease [Oceanobacillus bengalensis]